MALGKCILVEDTIWIHIGSKVSFNLGTLWQDQTVLPYPGLSQVRELHQVGNDYLPRWSPYILSIIPKRCYLRAYKEKLVKSCSTMTKNRD